MASQKQIAGLVASRVGTEMRPSLAVRLEEAREKYRLMDFGAARELLEGVFADIGADSRVADQAEIIAGAHVLKGQLLHDEGSRVEAQAEFKKAIRLLLEVPAQPGRRSADAGIAFWLTGERDKALEHLNTAVQSSASVWDAQRWLGIAFLERGDDAKAEQLLRQATEFLSRFATVRLAWAQALERLGRDNEALSQYTFAGGQLTGEGKSEAVEVLTKALRLDPGNVTTLVMLGEAERVIGNYPQALKHLDNALRKDPVTPRLWRSRPP